MRHSTILILAAGAAALAVSACGKKEDETATAGGASAPAASTAPAGSPAATKPKAGLWEQTMSGESMPSVTMKICLDDALAEKALAVGNQTQTGCSPSTATKNADGSWTMETTCDRGENGKTQVKSRATGDFASAYKMEMSNTTTGAAKAELNRSDKAVVDAKWVGPCPAGMNPGATEMNGMIIDPSGMK